jgi:hypothetical protein
MLTLSAMAAPSSTKKKKKEKKKENITQRHVRSNLGTSLESSYQELEGGQTEQPQTQPSVGQKMLASISPGNCTVIIVEEKEILPPNPSRGLSYTLNPFDTP